MLEGLEDRLLLSGGPTIYTVNSAGGGISGSGDSGTLPYVIGLANNDPNPAGSEIQFDPTVFASPQTITLSSTLVLSETAGPEVIDGPGANLVTVSGNNAVQVFDVASGVTTSFTGLTISGGSTVGDGGGIDSNGATTVTNCTIDDNSATGPVSDGGGIYNAGTMTVTNSTIDNNCAWGSAGWSSFGGGGGIGNSGTMTVTNSTIDNNSEVDYSGGGGIYNAGTMMVTNSTIADNSTNVEGGGIVNEGAMTVIDSTIADNSAGATTAAAVSATGAAR